jgi:hypothetical protein
MLMTGTLSRAPLAVLPTQALLLRRGRSLSGPLARTRGVRSGLQGHTTSRVECHATTVCPTGTHNRTLGP